LIVRQNPTGICEKRWNVFPYFSFKNRKSRYHKSKNDSHTEKQVTNRVFVGFSPFPVEREERWKTGIIHRKKGYMWKKNTFATSSLWPYFKRPLSFEESVF